MLIRHQKKNIPYLILRCLMPGYFAYMLISYHVNVQPILSHAVLGLLLLLFTANDAYRWFDCLCHHHWCFLSVDSSHISLILSHYTNQCFLCKLRLFIQRGEYGLKILEKIRIWQTVDYKKPLNKQKCWYDWNA